MDLHNNRRIGDHHPILLIFVIGYYIYTQNHSHPYTRTRSFPPSSYRSRRTALLVAIITSFFDKVNYWVCSKCFIKFLIKFIPFMWRNHTNPR